MIKRIEFSLNLDDPQDAHLYRALQPSLKYRRAGSIIRQALAKFYSDGSSNGKSTAHNETVERERKGVQS